MVVHRPFKYKDQFNEKRNEYDIIYVGSQGNGK